MATIVAAGTRANAAPTVVAAALLAAILTLMQATSAAAAAPTTVDLAMGDSLAVGDGASTPDRAYVPLLAEYFAGSAHGGAKQLVNVAVGGETTSSILGSQMANALAVIGDPNTDVRVISLSIGGNDLQVLLDEPSDPCVVDPSSFACQFGVAVALNGVATRYPVILGTLAAALAADPGTEKVFVLTNYNPFGGTGSPYEVPVDFALLGSDLAIDCLAIQTDPARAGLNDLIACSAAAFGDIVVDAYPVIGEDALALTHIGDPGFNVHPNDDGHALVAKAHRRADRD